jgi:hypothetical protein
MRQRRRRGIDIFMEKGRTDSTGVIVHGSRGHRTVGGVAAHDRQRRGASADAMRAYGRGPDGAAGPNGLAQFVNAAKGDPAAIATALEGKRMACAGRAGPALATAAIGSFVAGTIATVLPTLLAPWVAQFALKFGPAEYFALRVFAFVTVAAVLGSSTVRGLTAPRCGSSACSAARCAGSGSRSHRPSSG